jgi:ATPase subunit of ABC transporter with duplicated ATPase domains
MNPYLLEIENLDLSYGMVQVLRGVTVKAKPLGITAIVGPNGAGKTTLTRGVMGYVQPSAGTVKFEGSLILGLKQSRTVRISILINGHQEIAVPVHCVERGRWSSKTRTGHKSPYHLYTGLRASNLRHISDALRQRSGFGSRDSQSDTWRNIRARMQRMNVHSESGFAGDIFEGNKESIDHYLKAFKCPDTATGFLALINEHVLAMDIFATETLLQGNFQPLLLY